MQICAVAKAVLKRKINSNLIMISYLHFECLSECTYEFNCMICGFYPHISIADVNRKVAFKYTSPTENDLNEDDVDEVDCQNFWNDVAMEMMSRGFCSIKLNSLKVDTNLSYWALFTDKKSRIGYIIYNSEHLKVHRDDENVEVELREMSEEQLLETLLESSSKDVRLLARKVGVSSKGTRQAKTGLDKNNIKFNNIFRKMFGFSGGWLTVACRNRII